MSENGQVDTEVAEQAIQEPAGVAEKLWLHPDALRPRDYIRGKQALKDVLTAEGLDNCYDFLGTEWMYPWLIWALRSRMNPDFTWDDALDTPFHEFRMGDDPRPQIQPAASGGSNDSTPAGNASKARRPKPAAVPSSSPSSG